MVTDLTDPKIKAAELEGYRRGLASARNILHGKIKRGWKQYVLQTLKNFAQ